MRTKNEWGYLTEKEYTELSKWAVNYINKLNRELADIAICMTKKGILASDIKRINKLEKTRDYWRQQL